MVGPADGIRQDALHMLLRAISSMKNVRIRSSRSGRFATHESRVLAPGCVTSRRISCKGLVWESSKNTKHCQIPFRPPHIIFSVYRTDLVDLNHLDRSLYNSWSSISTSDTVADGADLPMMNLYPMTDPLRVLISENRHRASLSVENTLLQTSPKPISSDSSNLS